MNTTELSATDLVVRGMTCGGCVNNVKGVLGDLPGVAEVAVDLAAGRVSVRHDPARAPLDALREAIEAAGFDVEAPV